MAMLAGTDQSEHQSRNRRSPRRIRRGLAGASRGIELTTPHERTRSVLQTRHFLGRLMLSDGWPELPREIQDEARRLLRHFPEAWHLSKVHQRVPEEWGAVAAVLEEVPIRRHP